MRKRIPFSNLLLLLLALGVLGATLCEYVAARNRSAVALQEENVEESLEEGFEEELDFLDCEALFLPRFVEIEPVFRSYDGSISILCSARLSRSLGWSLPLRI